MDTNQDRRLESPPSTYSQRQSVLFKPSRRSTFLVRPLDQSEPIQENPNNTPERNQELQREYETLQALNSTLGKVSDNLEKTKHQFNHFNDTISRTNGLLDLWLEILEKTEEMKSLIENPDWQGSTSLDQRPTTNENNHTKKRRLNR